MVFEPRFFPSGRNLTGLQAESRCAAVDKEKGNPTPGRPNAREL
jgi:hypothetical protein